jgi:serine O-acetyltransferase
MQDDGLSGSGDPKAFWRDLRARHPGFVAAVVADAETAVRHRGEVWIPGRRLRLLWQIFRLIWVTDAFLAQMLYRAKARLQSLGVPILPHIAHRLAIVMGQVSIGDPVHVSPGVYIPHGHVVVDGIAEIGTGVVLSPFVTIGLRAKNLLAPTIEADVNIGSGAKVIGPVRVGAGAQIGAGAVVVSDVAPGSTVTGVPARAV